MSMSPGNQLARRVVGGLAIATQVAWPVICAWLAYQWAEPLWARGVILVGLWVVGGAVIWWLSMGISSWIYAMFDRK